MSDIHNGGFAAPPLPVPGVPQEALGGDKAALTLGIIGGSAAALFVLAHWSVAVVGALAVLALSAMESEPFLLLVTFSMPFAWLLEGHNVLLAMHAVVVVGFFAGRLFRGEAHLRRLFRPALSRASILFLCALAVPILLIKGELTLDSARAVYEMGTYIAFYFVILALVDSRQRMRKVLWTLLLSTILTAAFALYQQIIRGFSTLWLYLVAPKDSAATWTGRSVSFLGHPNHLAFYLGLVLPFALAHVVRGRGKWKRISGWTLALGMLALLSTQSVGGLVAFGAIGVMAILYFGPTRKAKIALLLAMGACGYLLYMLSPILNPSHTAETVGPDLLIRLVLWNTAWGYFLHSPIFGVGWGNFVRLYGPDLADLAATVQAGVFEVHNIYLQLLAESGLVGFAAFCYLMAQAWRQARRQWRSSHDSCDSALAFGVLGALLSLLVHGAIDVPFVAQFGTLLWVLLALLVASGRIQRQPVAAASVGIAPEPGRQNL